MFVDFPHTRSAKFNICYILSISLLHTQHCIFTSLYSPPPHTTPCIHLLYIKLLHLPLITSFLTMSTAIAGSFP